MTSTFEQAQRQWAVFYADLAWEHEHAMRQSQELVREAREFRCRARQLQEQLYRLRQELQEDRTLALCRTIHPARLCTLPRTEPERTFREAITRGLTNFLRSIRLAASVHSVPRTPST